MCSAVFKLSSCLVIDSSTLFITLYPSATIFVVEDRMESTNKSIHDSNWLVMSFLMSLRACSRLELASSIFTCLTMVKEKYFQLQKDLRSCVEGFGNDSNLNSLNRFASNSSCGHCNSSLKRFFHVSTSIRPMINLNLHDFLTNIGHWNLTGGTDLTYVLKKPLRWLSHVSFLTVEFPLVVAGTNVLLNDPATSVSVMEGQGNASTITLGGRLLFDCVLWVTHFTFLRTDTE